MLRKGQGGIYQQWQTQFGARLGEELQGSSNGVLALSNWWPNPWGAVLVVYYPVMVQALGCLMPVRDNLWIVKKHVGKAQE
jgi:hypothetical protein